ncbi:MAG: hypothetical protein GKS06_00060 [Acidobacteria bacterium]|nr:hypothetical protein [Acidobacteriota bacterium]
MARERRIPYPERHFGRWLQKAVQRKIDESSGLDSAAAVSRWLGHAEPTRMNKWIKGRLLPRPEDYAALAKLGLAREQIHELVAHDRMAALAHDEELDSAELLKTAASIAHLGGMSKAEVIRILQKADFEELERALESS